MRSKIVVYKAPAVAAQKPQKAYAAAFAALAMTLAGCATGLGANSYERGSVGTVSRVDEGTIVASRSIVIEGSQTGGMLGGATGAAVGAIAGSQIGGGSDERATGGVLGNTVGNMSTRKPGFAYTVRLRSGELVTITQGGDLAIANGTPVLVEYGDRARVIPQNISIR
jgi:outer membrane lipoprotein SlyB